jgi:hypothetical protein
VLFYRNFEIYPIVVHLPGNHWKMNDDVLACIGQYADADARRAMGLPPNRLPPSNDSRYDCLHKMLAQERNFEYWVEDDGTPCWTMRFDTDNYYHIIQIEYNRDDKAWGYYYGPRGRLEFWTMRLLDDGNLESQHHWSVFRVHYKSVWKDGRWVRTFNGDTH